MKFIDIIKEEEYTPEMIKFEKYVNVCVQKKG